MFCKQDDDEVLKKNERFPSLVLQLMYDMFGIKNVQRSDDKMIHVTLDNSTAKLDPYSVVSSCNYRAMMMAEYKVIWQKYTVKFLSEAWCIHGKIVLTL